MATRSGSLPHLSRGASCVDLSCHLPLAELLARNMRRSGIEPDDETVTVASGLRLAWFNSLVARSRLMELLAEKCADRELNPGYELGKLMSYH